MGYRGHAAAREAPRDLGDLALTLPYAYGPVILEAYVGATRLEAYVGATRVVEFLGTDSQRKRWPPVRRRFGRNGYADRRAC
jgi:hypothetical protein